MTKDEREGGYWTRTGLTEQDAGKRRGLKRCVYEVNSGVFVPLAVPAGGTLEQLWTRESVSLSSEFLRDYLIPACKECGCTN